MPAPSSPVRELARHAICVCVSSAARRAWCPRCDVPSARVHSRYERVLADAALAGQLVVIRLRVRRFFCGTPDARPGQSWSR
ncbi:transposase family protein [Amycolatopsis samaneae]|uniref:Transposase family protein n=1 Tax=Amycolatopsis samaneae TaxID=664691 RepID=A0ABW5GP98_9PSEU